MTFTRKSFFFALLLTSTSVSISGCVDLDKLRKHVNHSTAGSLTTADIAEGLKEALRVGSGNVVKQLGRHDGFNKDKVAHIVLPEKLDKVRTTLRKIGYSQQLDELEVRINRAAEQATPKAKALFINAIKQLSWDDVKRIYHGPNDAATRYFQGKMSPPLKQQMKPVINKALAQAGVIRSYENIMSKYNSLPFVPDVRADLTDYTIDKSLHAIFYYLAKEEAAIRKDPARRTTEILRKVFG